MTFIFNANPRIVSDHLIIEIPLDISKEFPSRGMLMAQVRFHEQLETVAIEPSGFGGHWFEILPDLIEVEVTGAIKFELSLLESWPPPIIEPTFMYALATSGAMAQWDKITNKAKWEWVRWIRSTANENTRKKRIETACDKLLNGQRRPCCFDTTRCTVVAVSKSGKLIL